MLRPPAAEAPARDVGVAIVGSGLAGLGAAIARGKAGFHDVVLLERAATLGGVWRDNTYPGCACDVPSHLYSFSFAPKADWSRAYAPQAEIRAYLEAVADRFDVRRRILFEREVTTARWDGAAGRWLIATRTGETFRARVLVLAIGALSNPALADLPGQGRFRGPQFHSARWDHGVDLAGKRVAVVGTGASAVQFVPWLQPRVARLHLLQRTPPWILPRHDSAFGPWRRALFRAVPGARWLYRQYVYWRLEGRVLAFVDHPALMRLVELEAKRHLAKSIRDPALRARLTPDYRPGCKRLLMSDDYYPALARPNVEVVSEPVAEVVEHGIRLAGGRTLEVDAIVHGTGFRVHDHLGGLAVLGRGGQDLGALWADGAEAYLGTAVAGFPNLFVMTGPNTGLGHSSMIFMIEAQARFVRRALEHLRASGSGTIEVKAEAQAAFNAWLRGRLSPAVWGTGCRSWYLDRRGRNTTLWPGYTASFRARTARLRTDHFEVRGAGEPA